MSSPAAELQSEARNKLLSPFKALQMSFALFRLSEAQRFLILALLIGVFSGILVVLFHIAIDFLTWSSLGALTGRFR